MYNINIFCSNNPYTYSFFAENEKKNILSCLRIEFFVRIKFLLKFSKVMLNYVFHHKWFQRWQSSNLHGNL